MAAVSGLIRVMEKAARKAGNKLRRDFGEVEHLQVSRKGPADFVSKADQVSERTLYDELLATLRRQRFVNVYAGIALPNPASVALHESIGMRRIGVYERVGFKHGRWVDVAWYGVPLSEPIGVPSEPIPYAELG